MGLYIKPRSGGSSLPPAPAPTARDANPWPMPEQYGDRPESRKGPQRTTGIPTLTGPRARPPTTLTPAPMSGPSRLEAPAPSSGPSRHERPPPESEPVANNPLQSTRDRVRFAPLLVMAGVAVGAVAAARRAWLVGDYAAAIGPLLVVVVLVFSAWRSSRRH